MKHFPLFLCSCVCLAFLLSACASSEMNTKKVTCNKLKSDLIFGGATSNPRQAAIQKAEKHLQQANYDSNDCAPSTSSLTSPF